MHLFSRRSDLKISTNAKSRRALARGDRKRRCRALRFLPWLEAEFEMSERTVALILALAFVVVRRIVWTPWEQGVQRDDAA
jgi:hypothetical protein